MFEKRVVFSCIGFPFYFFIIIIFSFYVPLSSQIVKCSVCIVD
jgi:hypothetical protein